MQYPQYQSQRPRPNPVRPRPQSAFSNLLSGLPPAAGGNMRPPKPPVNSAAMQAALAGGAVGSFLGSQPLPTAPSTGSPNQFGPGGIYGYDSLRPSGWAGAAQGAWTMPGNVQIDPTNSNTTVRDANGNVVGGGSHWTPPSQSGVPPLRPMQSGGNMYRPPSSGPKPGPVPYRPAFSALERKVGAYQ